MKIPKVMPPESFPIPFTGGLNTEMTPPFLPKNMCRDALNFEQNVGGGYSLISGYEGYDGQPSPSSNPYWYIETELVGTPPAIGTLITDDDSAAPNTAKLIATNGTEGIAVVDLADGFDVASNVSVTTTAVGTTPANAAYCPSNDRLYVANQGSGNVSVINPSTNTVVATITVGTTPNGICYCQSNNRLYVPNTGSNSVSVINPATNTVVATVTGVAGATMAGYCASNDRVYVTRFSADAVAVINPATNAVVATITVGTSPNGLCYSPTTDRVYVCNSGTNTLSVINPATNTVVSTITVGNGPTAADYCSSNQFVYVANVTDGTVSVIDETNAVVATITVGTAPRRIAYCSGNDRVYVSNSTSADIDVIIPNSNTVSIHFATSAAPRSIVYCPTTDTIFVTSISSNDVVVYKAHRTINSGGPAVWKILADPVENGAPTGALDNEYRNLAAADARTSIAAVPGSGLVRGVRVLNDVRYAWRDNAGATACDVYKATIAGWVKVTLGYELTFTAGDTLVEGQTLNQGGVFATILRVALLSGDLSTGTGVGKLIVDAPTGGSFAAGAATTSGPGSLTLGGVEVENTFLPGGRFEFRNKNMTGFAGDVKIYGCDGVNRGFEMDNVPETYVVFIDTGMTPDAPNHVDVFHYQLFFFFSGSAQHAAPGEPYIWSPIFGASELALGDDVTGSCVQRGAAGDASMAIFCRQSVSILYGTGVADWNLVEFKFEFGALPYTIEQLSRSMFLDDRGVATLEAVQSYGNFKDATITHIIDRFIKNKINTAIASCICREKNQYRLFFEDNSSIYITFNGTKVVGIMPMMFSHAISCTCSQELSDGTEVMYFGSDDGFVYQMDRGTSFDGGVIEYLAKMAFSTPGGMNVMNSFKGGLLQVAGNYYASIGISAELYFGDEGTVQSPVEQIEFEFSGRDQNAWNDRALLEKRMDIRGDSQNISLIISGESDSTPPFTLTVANLFYNRRRQSLAGA